MKRQLAYNARIIFIFFKGVVISIAQLLVSQRTSALEFVRHVQIHATYVVNSYLSASNAEVDCSCSMAVALQIAQLTKVISVMRQVKHANCVRAHANDVLP
jgi:hypothetical protein